MIHWCFYQRCLKLRSPFQTEYHSICRICVDCRFWSWFPLRNKFQWQASPVSVFLVPFQAWFPPCAALLCLHALTRFVSWEKSIPFWCLAVLWKANCESWFFLLRILCCVLLFCCAAVYLVAQYARREIKRMEGVICCDLLIIVFNGINYLIWNEYDIWQQRAELWIT